MMILCHIIVLILNINTLFWFKRVHISFMLVFCSSELAHIRPTKKIVLHKDVSDRTIVSCMVLDNLSSTFPVNQMIKYYRHSFRCVDQRHFGAPLLTIPKDGLPVFYGVSSRFHRTTFLDSGTAIFAFANSFFT